jgi:perosamine synthetase
MRKIDASGAGVVFIVDSNGRLRGLLTDGDVRRALLGGAELRDPVERHANGDFVAGSSTSSRNNNLALMSERIRHLPLLNAVGHLVDFLSWRDLWQIPLVSPSFEGNELRYVQDCIVSGWVSSQGPYIQRFEEALRTFVGTDHAVSTANGTLALQLALQALNISRDDEVIVPDFTFGASANAVIQCGARPVFVDVDPDTWTIDPVRIEAAITGRTKAIIAVHIYGHPCDMDPILAIARRHGITVVEDCAQALGARYKGRRVGSLGDVGCFSFFANKIITTGEGGMCTTNNPLLADRLALLRDHGMRPQRRYWHEEAGMNARMTNLQAAVGVGQMERVDHFLELRDRLAARYQKALAEVPGIRLHAARPWARKVTWLYTITIEAADGAWDRDTLLAELEQHGIECRPTFLPLHAQPAFAGAGRQEPFTVSERLGRTGLSLPTGNDTPMIEVVRVTEEILARIGVAVRSATPTKSG